MRTARHLARLRSVLAAALALGAVGCGGGGGGGSSDDGDGAVPVPGVRSDEPRWTVDRFAYTGGAGGSAGSVTDDFGVIVVSTTGFDRTNGAWSGGGIGVAHSLDGPGAYAIIPMGEPVTPGSRVAQVNVTVGTLNVMPLASRSCRLRGRP